MRLVRWNQAHWKSRFFTIWSGQALSLFGSQIVQFALVWWLTERTGSATVLATATIVALIPQIVFSPFAGALVHRWNRRRVLIVADSAIALAALGLAILFSLDVVRVWHVYVMIFVRSVGASFHWTAMFASTSMMVPQENLSRVAGLNSALQGSANLISPLIAAFLLGMLTMPAIIGIDVITALFAVLPLVFISIPQPSRGSDHANRGPSALLHEIGKGIQYLRSQPGLLMVILIAILLNFFAFPAFTLLPLYVTEYFGRQAIDFATLQSVRGAGMIAGGLILAAWKHLKRRVVVALAGVMLQGAGMVVMGFAPTSAFLLAVLCLLFISLLSPIINGGFMVTFQSIIPHDKQGRVISLLSSGAQLMSPLGLVLAGPVADRFGVNMWFVLAGGASILLGLFALFVPAIVKLDTLSAEINHEAPDPAEPPEAAEV